MEIILNWRACSQWLSHCQKCLTTSAWSALSRSPDRLLFTRKSVKKWEINKTKVKIQPRHHKFYQKQPNFFILVVMCKNRDNVFSHMFGFLVLGWLWIQQVLPIITDFMTRSFRLVAQNKQKPEVWDWRSVIFQGFWAKKKCCYNFDNII